MIEFEEEKSIDSNENDNNNDEKIIENKQKISRLVCKKELPPWYSHYKFVLNGYRINYSIKDAFKSMFQWHNETANIYTELLPALFLMISAIIFVFTDPAVW